MPFHPAKPVSHSPLAATRSGAWIPIWLIAGLLAWGGAGSARAVDAREFILRELAAGRAVDFHPTSPEFRIRFTGGTNTASVTVSATTGGMMKFRTD